MSEAVKARALSLVGNGYIYGAKGQTCSPDFRQRQAAQYPEYASMIMGTGAKWDGRPVWDCAQLTRACAKAGGVTLVSGATSQWNKTEWARKGAIDTLPPDEAAFLYRQADGRMQHTGVYLGDGTFVHAQGTAYGVLHEPMARYAWTHWGIPKWPETGENGEDENMSLDMLYTARVVAQNGNTVNMRNAPGGAITAKIPIDTVVGVIATGAGWMKILYGTETGYMQSAFLKRVEEMVTLTIERSDALRLIEALETATARG